MNKCGLLLRQLRPSQPFLHPLQLQRSRPAGTRGTRARGGHAAEETDAGLVCAEDSLPRAFSILQCSHLLLSHYSSSLAVLPSFRSLSALSMSRRGFIAPSGTLVLDASRPRHLEGVTEGPHAEHSFSLRQDPPEMMTGRRGLYGICQLDKSLSIQQVSSCINVLQWHAFG